MRDKLIQVRVSEEEKEAAEKLAQAEQRTVASLFRRWLSLEADKHIILKDSAKSN